jgi:hypothetical protein
VSALLYFTLLYFYFTFPLADTLSI